MSFSREILARAPCSRHVPQFRALRPGRSWVWDEEKKNLRLLLVLVLVLGSRRRRCRAPPRARPRPAAAPPPPPPPSPASLSPPGGGQRLAGAAGAGVPADPQRPSPALAPLARLAPPRSPRVRVLVLAAGATPLRCAAREEVAAEGRATGCRSRDRSGDRS